jgi:hypothetical protein
MAKITPYLHAEAPVLFGVVVDRRVTTPGCLASWVMERDYPDGPPAHNTPEARVYWTSWCRVFLRLEKTWGRGR